MQHDAHVIAAALCSCVDLCGEQCVRQNDYAIPLVTNHEIRHVMFEYVWMASVQKYVLHGGARTKGV